MKGKKAGRTVVLHEQARLALYAYLQSIIVSGNVDMQAPLFPSQKDRNAPLSRVHAWRILDAAYKQCELSGKLGTHAMRKSFANRVYEKLNRDLVKTQKALGHKSVTSTVSYLSFKQEEIDEAILAT